MKKIDALMWWCIGVISHDLVSVYLPGGGHIEPFHAWYFAFPILVVVLIWKEWHKKK